MRPTSERARAGLFDWLGPDLEDRVVLDLFAGTGALGIEALSRGAAHAVFIERDAAACRALRRNLEELELLEHAEVLSLDIAAGLARLGARGAVFGLVMADPPWDSPWTGRLLERGQVDPLIGKAGILILERRKDTTTGPADGRDPGLLLCETRSYGGTSFDRYEWEESREP